MHLDAVFALGGRAVWSALTIDGLTDHDDIVVPPLLGVLHSDLRYVHLLGQLRVGPTFFSRLGSHRDKLGSTAAVVEVDVGIDSGGANSRRCPYSNPVTS